MINKKERGVALIMSLGILSVLIVLAISFIFNSKINVLVSKSYDRNSQARRVGNDSIYWMRRAMLHWVSKKQKATPNRFIGLAASQNQDIWPGTLDLTIDKASYMKFEDDDGSALTYELGFLASAEPEDIKDTTVRGLNTQKLSWWGILSFENRYDLEGNEIDYGHTASNAHHTETVGRRATVMVAEDIKFDLNSLVLANEFGLKGANIFPLETILKIYNVGAPETIAKKLYDIGGENYKKNDQKALPWLSWEQIWNSKVFTTDPEFPTPAEEKTARKAYNALNPYTGLEGLWFEWGGWSGVSKNYYHKYYLGNLNRVRASDIEFNPSVGASGRPKIYKTKDIPANCEFFDDSKYENMQKAREDRSYKGADSADSKNIHTHTLTKSIPWLGTIRGHFGEDEYNNRLRQQVAANLVDYVDEDSSSSTDHESGSFEKFSFCGLEKSLYTSSVGLALEVKAFQPGLDLILAEPVVYLKGVNLYSEPMTGSAKVYVNLDIDGKLVTLGPVTETITDRKTAEVRLPAIELPVNSSGAYNIEVKADLLIEIGKGDVTLIKNLGESQGISGTPGQNFSVYCNFRDPRANNFIDFTEDDKYADLFLDEKEDVWQEGDDVKQTVSDYTPENNLSIANEAYGKSQTVNGLNAFVSDKPPFQISKYYVGLMMDHESNPNKPSTAVIRNGEIRDLWELGAVHRGEPWRTLNIKTSMKTRNYKDKSGVDHVLAYGKYSGEYCMRTPTSKAGKWWHKFSYNGQYQYGDGAILDQVKITKEAFSYGLVNVFNPTDNYWDVVYECLSADPKVPAASSYLPSGGKYYIKPSEIQRNDVRKIQNMAKHGNNNAAGLAGVPFFEFGGNFYGLEGMLFMLHCSGLYNDDSSLNVASSTFDFRNSTPKNDFDAEELPGKIASHYKERFNFFRVVSTTQMLDKVSGAMSNRLDRLEGSENSENSLRHFRKIEEHYWGENLGYRWYKITAQTKQMALLKRYSGKNWDLEVVEQQTVDSNAE